MHSTGLRTNDFLFLTDYLLKTFQRNHLTQFQVTYHVGLVLWAGLIKLGTTSRLHSEL